MSKSINKRVMLGLSGGVDSAVSAIILQKAGFEVLGLTLVFSCDSKELQDTMLEGATDLASQIGIRHIVHDAISEFNCVVIKPFLNAWRQGNTPNPCTICNPKIKFPKLLDLAEEYGCAYIATGHYAATGDQDGHKLSLTDRSDVDYFSLLRGFDRRKDQSYFLYALPQDFLNRCLFPLADLTKERVRRIATEESIKLIQKADSQEICFIADDDRIEFLRKHEALGEPGPYLNTKGEVIGQHAGIGHYTIGQRKKLGQAFGKRMTVLKIDVTTNSIVLGDECECYSNILLIRNLITTKMLDQLFSEQKIVSAEVQLRSQGKPMPCRIERLPGNGEARVFFSDDVRLTAPGQSAVFYKEDMVLGGGTVVS